MAEFNFILLYVQDHRASAAHYATLLGLPVVDQKDDISILPLRDGVMLGLWARDHVAPSSASAPGAHEIAVAVPDAATVEGLHADWSARGVGIAQPPTAMSFGTTFVALDPDGHRLRVYAPNPA
jgi:catechol-2,3-dioxygenase